MPTDIVLSNDKRRSVQERDVANLIAALLLVPLIACLGSILLSIESPQFSAAIVVMASE